MLETQEISHGNLWLSVSLDCAENGIQHVCVLNSRSRVLFTGPTSTKFSKFFIKTWSYSTIHTFKNYFVTMFLVFSNKWYPKISPSPTYLEFSHPRLPPPPFKTRCHWTKAALHWYQQATDWAAACCWVF